MLGTLLKMSVRLGCAWSTAIFPPLPGAALKFAAVSSSISIVDAECWATELCGSASGFFVSLRLIISLEPSLFAQGQGQGRLARSGCRSKAYLEETSVGPRKVALLPRNGGFL